MTRRFDSTLKYLFCLSLQLKIVLLVFKRNIKVEVKLLNLYQMNTIFYFFKRTCEGDETFEINIMATQCLFNNHFVCLLYQISIIVLGNDRGHRSVTNRSIVSYEV